MFIVPSDLCPSLGEARTCPLLPVARELMVTGHL